MKSKKMMFITAAVVCLVLLASVAGITAYADTDKDTICKGIFINTVDVGGMTKNQAISAVEEYLISLQDKKVTVLVDSNPVETTVSNFGLAAKLEETVDQAVNFGKTGNFIKRYKAMKDLERETLILPLEITLDTDKVESFVKEECSVFNVSSKNASLSRENGTFIVTPHKVGRKVKTEDTRAKIQNILLNEWDYEDVTIEAVVAEDEPKYTTEKVALCKDVLGTFSTTYATSSASRANNLANGAKLINGSIIWPGKTFSTGKAMQPITVDNGYSIAGAYQNGQVIDSIGGGVCQVATTLYNAALKAEVEIAERHNHSMIVGYVEPSMDAAIAGNYKDLKIKNTSDVPYYIEASTVGRTITFTIYGQETRDLKNRVVKYESKVLERIQPGKEKITEDKTKPETYRKVTQSAHVGYKAELWKVVYINDVEVSRERVNYSSYAAEPAYVTVGVKAEKEEEPEEGEEGEDPEETKPAKPSKKPKPSKEPEVSEEPEISEEPEFTEEPTETPIEIPEESEEPPIPEETADSILIE